MNLRLFFLVVGPIWIVTLICFQKPIQKAQVAFSTLSLNGDRHEYVTQNVANSIF